MLVFLVEKIGYCVVIQEVVRYCGVVVEIIVLLNELVFNVLKVSFVRVVGYDILMFYFWREDDYLFNVGDIVNVVKVIFMIFGECL